MDLIDRQAAIDAIITQEAVYADDAIDVLRRLPSTQPEQRWIPVSERLPKENSDILVTYVEKDEERIVPVNYGHGMWFDCIFNRALNPVGVLAWVALPEPYKERREG